MDIIIKNGKIIDGTGNPWFYADIGIENERIVKIKQNLDETSEKEIDARGMIVCPGFIDAHTHSDLVAITNKTAFNYITQGVTTNVIGNCGFTAAPINQNTVSDLISLVAPDLDVDLTKLWQSFEDFLNFFDGTRFTINLAPLVGHGTLRIAVMGLEKRMPTPEELTEMKKLIEESMIAGSFGISAGLEYLPGMFAKPSELIELCKVVSNYNGIFAVHVRNEGDLGKDAVDEAIYIAQMAKIPLQISHLKLDGRKNWGKANERLKQLENARENGIDVTTDVYPYTFCMTGIHALFPDWVFENGLDNAVKKLEEEKIKNQLREYYKNGTSMLAPSSSEAWDNVILSNAKNPNYKGKSILKVANENNLDIIDAMRDIITTEGIGMLVALQGMNEKDVIEIAQHPLSMVGSDGEVRDIEDDKIHPRYYGTYPRYLRKLVFDGNILRLEEAIRKMTSFPANKFEIKNRGLIKEGFFADITIFDPNNLKDQATLEKPNKKSEGIEFVIINGKIVLENGDMKRKYPGRVLRNNSQN
ncbi:MAG: N-acyl-D-amino-acid deacylase family protein [Promethearchaeati archaeon]